MKQIILLPLVLLVACTSDDEVRQVQTESPGTESPLGPIALADLAPLGEADASGTVTFEETDDGVDVFFDVQGLSEGLHGFHVHENGSCEMGEDGTPGGAAGGHFNPDGAPHGSPDTTAAARHAGDLGNVEAGSDGAASGTFVDEGVALDGPRSIDGKALVIHGGEDDLTSQPSGDAGARVACGVIALQE